MRSEIKSIFGTLNVLNVLNVIKHGYFLPLIAEPPGSFDNNNKSSFKHPTFVTHVILELLKAGCNPITVAEGKKLRLVLDLRNVNEYITNTKFKYDNLSTVAEILEKYDFFTTFDLTSGYHHVPIAKKHQTFLGFE